MAGENTNVEADEDRLNVTSTADQGEVAEVEKLLNPRKPEDERGENGEGGADPDDDDEEDAQRGKVDEELESAASDDEREKIKERRRQERRDKRNRHRERVANLERQLQSERQQRQQLSERLLHLEQSNTGTQYAALKQQEEQLDAAIEQLSEALEVAVSKSDGKTARLATERLQEARNMKHTVQLAKQQMEQTSQRSAPADPEMVNHAKAFAKKHSWYKGPRANDMDSRMLTTLDNALTSEGWNPATPAYWEELESRMGRYIPHRASGAGGAATAKNPPERGGTGYNAADASGSRPAARSPVAGSSGSSTGGGGKQTYKLSEDRVRAMKEAGFWDDPKKRDRMIQRYREQDARDGK